MHVAAKQELRVVPQAMAKPYIGLSAILPQPSRPLPLQSSAHKYTRYEQRRHRHRRRHLHVQKKPCFPAGRMFLSAGKVAVWGIQPE